MDCQKCGTVNAESSSFCVQCGTPLAEPAGPKRAAQRGMIGSGALDALTGTTLDGKYQLESKIAVGGMGVVYLAKRLHIGDQVAVKILREDRLNDAENPERFRREVQMAAQLKHPNLVAIYDFNVTENNLRYFVMEWVEGLNLRQIIKQRGALPLAFAADIVTQTCAALTQAHGQNIVHRDVKPDNIMVQELSSGGIRVKVLDLGVAKLRDETASDLTQSGNIVGTPRYMSPEQCLGETTDGRSDIYSLGVVFYEMLAGNAPFSAPTSTAIAVQHVTTAPPSLAHVNPPIPAEIQKIVFHALEKKRADRPANAAAFADELNAALSGTQTSPPVIASAPPPLAANAFNSTVNAPLPPGFGTSIMETPPNFAVNTTQMPPLSTRGNNNLWIAATATLGVLLLFAVGALAFFLGAQSSQEKTGIVNNVRPINNAEANTNANAAASPAPPANNADEAIARLTPLIDSPTTKKIQLTQASNELQKLEKQFPGDYRLLYQRAKILALRDKHHPALELLMDAARVAIANEQADQMLAEITRDKEGNLEEALNRDHTKDRIALENALKQKDDGLLPEEEH